MSPVEFIYIRHVYTYSRYIHVEVVGTAEGIKEKASKSLNYRLIVLSLLKVSNKKKSNKKYKLQNMLFVVLYLCYLRRTDFFIVNFENISHLVVVFLSLNLSM